MGTAVVSSELQLTRRYSRHVVLAALIAATACHRTFTVCVVECSGAPLTPSRRPFKLRPAPRLPVVARRQPSVLSYLPEEEEFTASIDWHRLGGARTRAMLVAAIAACSAYVLHLADIFCRSQWSLPLWLPPTAGVCIMYALDSVTAAEHMPNLDLQFQAQLAVRTVVALLGSCSLAVLIGSIFKCLVVRRVMAVAMCTAWMLLVPKSNFFPPSAAYAAIYVDHLQTKGPLAHLTYRYAAFPCALGVLIVYFSTHLLAFLAMKPLRFLTTRKRE
mmetsp:Transcript_24519/g.56510  ORF Transcript_24519/g.56510 Transcript_24519/m.56510 type:complete len:274 (+) Transcript_24519:51-872(+)